MSTNVQSPVTGARETAALLIAQDQLTDMQIAAECGVKASKTIQRWRNDPVIAARVAEHRASWRAEIKAKGIADVQNRVDEANARHLLMKQVIAERAADPTMEGIPGGTTGLLVRQVKFVKVLSVKRDRPTSLADEPEHDDDIITPERSVAQVEEYAVDTALLHELRMHEDEVAKHLGQLVERREDKLDATDSFLGALRAFGKGA